MPTTPLTVNTQVPRLIEGGLVVDDRGEVAFVNDCDLTGVRRLYIVSHHRSGFIRAWHAHHREAKYVTAIQGAAVVAAVAIDDWDHPSKDAPIHRVVLSAHKPAVFCIPPGYANGSMSLTADARLLFLSTATLKESAADDVRYDASYWDAWQVVER